MARRHARRHDYAVATVSMHAHAWVLCEAALCAARSACKLIAQHTLSAAEQARIKSEACKPSSDSLEWSNLTAVLIRVPHTYIVVRAHLRRSQELF